MREEQCGGENVVEAAAHPSVPVMCAACRRRQNVLRTHEPALQ